MAVSTAVAYLVARGLHGLDDQPGKLGSGGGARDLVADAVVFVAAAWLLRFTEVTSILDIVARRIPGTRGR